MGSKNAVAIQEPTQLQVIVQESGLETTKANILLKRFEDYFAIASEWETRAKVIVINDENCFTDQGKYDIQAARNGRLFLRDKRIAIEKTRKELKEQSLREGRAIDGIANVLKALIVPIEEYLEKQEHFVEHKAAAEAERIAEEMREKAEADRIKREKEEEAARAAEERRIRKENERLKAEAEKRERLLEKEREAARKKQEQQNRALAEQRARDKEERRVIEEKARKEREAAERKAEADRKKAQAEADASLKAERDKQAKLMELIQSDIECPHCHKKFKLQEVTGGNNSRTA